MNKLSIITIHKGPTKDLIKTINSVANQNHIPFDHLIISPKIPVYFKDKYNKKYIKYIIGRDKSIYNAMNIGLNLTRKRSILFLNSGDVFFNKDCVKNIYEAINKNPNKINIFKIILKHNKNYYIPKKSYFYSKKYLPHPCFIRPPIFINKNFIKFEEKFKTISDGLWMKKNIKLFSSVKINQNLVIHSIGGVSTAPSFQLASEKKKMSYSSYIKELAKLILIYLLGEKLFYKLLYSKKFCLNEKK